MKDSKIEWCENTFNPWRGCTKVSPGCAHCYAETLSHRNPALLGVWGKGQPRVRASAAMWQQPMRWNEQAIHFLECHQCGWRGVRQPDAVCPTPGCLTFFSEMASARPRVFCASLADWLDDEVPVQWFADLLTLIYSTSNLDWLLLSKRPQNFRSRLLERLNGAKAGSAHEWMWLQNWYDGRPPANVWIGTSVEDQTRADERIPLLLSIPARVRFLSCEPLLGKVNLVSRSQQRGEHYKTITGTEWLGRDEPMIHWVIAGGESGPNARPMHPEWARFLRDQCVVAGVPFLFKQWGEWLPFKMGAAYTKNFAASDVVTNGQGATGWPVYRVGKKAAGRLLDGVEHDGFPALESEVAR